MKTARMTIELFGLTCPTCDQGPFPEEGAFVDDQTGSYSLGGDSTVQGKHLIPGDILKCARCGTRCRIPARP